METSVAPGSQNLDEGQHNSMSGQERKREVNRLGLQWLLNLIERVERVHSKVLSQDAEGNSEALVLLNGYLT